MKKPILLAALLVLIAASGAAVTLENVSVNPGSDDTIWISEDFSITADCTDDESNGDIILYMDDLSLPEEGVSYSLDSNDLRFSGYNDGNGFRLSAADLREYLSDTGRYSYGLECERRVDGAVKEAANYSDTLLVHELSASYSGETDFSTLFTGEEAEVVVDVMKGSDSPVTSDTSFTVSIAGQDRMTRAPAYVSGEGWSLEVKLPTDPGTYTMNVTAEHDGAQTSVSRQIEVRQAEGLSVVSFPRQVDRAGGNVTLELDATHKGEDVAVDAADIQELSFDDEPVEYWDEDDSTFTVAIPSREPGTYDLSAEVDTGEVADTVTGTVVVPLSISGRFTTRDDSGIQYEMAVSGDRDYSASGTGEYDLDVAPDTYDITMTFPHVRHRATLALEETEVAGDWSDALTYRRYTDAQVPGLRLAGLHAFDIAANVTHDPARLTMEYDAGAVDDPQALAVFRCTAWNRDRARCTGDWSEVAASFDRVAGTVTITDAAPGAYAVGVRERLDPRYSRETTTYLPGRTVAFTGVVDDGSGDPVADAKIAATVAGTTVTNTSNDDGVFRIAFPAPQQAGEHTVDLTVTRDPFRPVDTAASLTVERPARLTVTAPDSVSMRPNTTRNVSLYIENTGFRQIDSIRPDTTDVPFNHSISFDARPLAVNESREVTLRIAVPPGTETTTESATVAFTVAEDNRAATTFGVAVESDGAMASTTGQVSRGESLLPAMPDVQGAATGLLPDGLPLGPLAAAVLFIQAVIVAAAYLHGRDPVERDHVDRAMSHLKAEVGQVESAVSDRVHGSGRERTAGQTREGVMRGVAQLKREIDAARD